MNLEFSVQIMSGIYSNSPPSVQSPHDRVYAFIAVKQGELGRFLVVTKTRLFLHPGKDELYGYFFTDPYFRTPSSALTRMLSHALVDDSSSVYVSNQAPQAPQARPAPQTTPQAFLSPPAVPPAPVYVPPAPVYVPPAPVYVPPAPVYAPPAPVYAPPAPVYAPPAPVYAPPAPVYAPPAPVYAPPAPVYVPPAPVYAPPAPVYAPPAPVYAPPAPVYAQPVWPAVAPPPVHVQQTIQQVPISGTNYNWTFANWRGSPNVPPNLSFNVTLAVMAACHTVAYGQSTLSFVRHTGFQQTHPTHIAISTQGSTYDLVAIRPSTVLETKCTAMFQKRSEDVFVWCTLSVNNAWNVPGLFMEWIVPHIDTGRWIVGDSALPSTGILLQFDRQVSMDFRPNAPKSVVSSFATASIYEDSPLLARISGTNMKGACDKNNTVVKWAVVSSMTSNTNDLGGAVQISGLENRYQDRINSISSLNCKALDSVYFNSDTYTTNPHFRFTPPWFSGEPDSPSILCIGDSLTASYQCNQEDPSSYIAPAYHTILQAHLTRVGITASIVNIGRPGSAIWSISTPPAESGNWSSDINQKPHQPQYQTNSGNKWTLAIIWLGTNDLWYVQESIRVKNYDAAGIKASLSADFEGLMRKYNATHYLLVKVDGKRNCTWPAGPQGALPRGPDGAIACNLEDGQNATDIVNETLLELEQKYHNVHVADIDYAVDRCREPDMAGAYVHFASNEGIARSLFGRIMCHAVFHRDTGDVRWVGAIPNVKLNRPDRTTFG
jgi:hypothetical protein